VLEFSHVRQMLECPHIRLEREEEHLCAATAAMLALDPSTYRHEVRRFGLHIADCATDPLERIEAAVVEALRTTPDPTRCDHTARFVDSVIARK
jgi:hypothetical protein